MNFKNRFSCLGLLTLLALVGCGGDPAPPWENDSRADKGHKPKGVPGLPNQDPREFNPPPPVNLPRGDGSALAKLFPTGLLDKNGNQISPSQLAGKRVGIYFAAHWSSACHDFTPALVEFRNRHANEFEVVFVSLCNSEAEKSGFIQEANMSFLSTPGARTEAGAELARRFNVGAIPQLVVLSSDGSVVTENGDRDIKTNPGGALRAWR